MKSKKIAFYSFGGICVPTLAALAFSKPAHTRIIWYVRVPNLRSEFIDSVLAVEQMGFEVDLSHASVSHRLLHHLAKRKHRHFLQPTLQRNNKNSHVTFKLVGSDWDKSILEDKPDALFLPTIRVETYEVLKRIASQIPIFLHEYGNTLKKISAFDLHKERHELMSAIFCPGTTYQQQLKSRGIKVPNYLTGSSKADLYFGVAVCAPPTVRKYMVYCNSASHSKFYDPSFSQPQHWIPILQQLANELDYELIVKLHPSSYFLYNHSEFAHSIYNSPYSGDLFKGAELIVSDLSSVMLEGMIAGKPLFLTDHQAPYSRSLSKAQLEYLKGLPVITDHHRKNIKLVHKKLAEPIRSDMKTTYGKEWWYKNDGLASERIWNKVMSLI